MIRQSFRGAHTQLVAQCHVTLPVCCWTQRRTQHEKYLQPPFRVLKARYVLDYSVTSNVDMMQSASPSLRAEHAHVVRHVRAHTQTFPSCFSGLDAGAQPLQLLYSVHARRSKQVVVVVVVGRARVRACAVSCCNLCVVPQCRSSAEL